MKTLRDLLQDADPLSHEPHRLERERERLRQAVVVGVSGVTRPSSAWLSTPIALVVTVAMIAVGLAAVGSQIWPQRGSTLQAQIRFEVRLSGRSADPRST